MLEVRVSSEEMFRAVTCGKAGRNVPGASFLGAALSWDASASDWVDGSRNLFIERFHSWVVRRKTGMLTLINLFWPLSFWTPVLRKIAIIIRLLRFAVTKTTGYINQEIMTRNSSGDEIANVNFLYDDIVHAIHNTIDWCINSATDRRGSQVYQIQWNNAMQRPLRRSRSFKVTDCGTNRKLIYDLLLVIYTNLPPILHRLQSYGWLFVKFLLASGECLTLTLSLGVIPCQYRHK